MLRATARVQECNLRWSIGAQGRFNFSRCRSFVFVVVSAQIGSEFLHIENVWRLESGNMSGLGFMGAMWDFIYFPMPWIPDLFSQSLNLEFETLDLKVFTNLGCCQIRFSWNRGWRIGAGDWDCSKYGLEVKFYGLEICILNIGV